MQLTEHEPGPWTASRGVYENTGKSYHGIFAPDKSFVAYLPGSDDPQEDANGHLIAAAPEMLEALRAIQQGFIDKTIRFAKRRQSDSEPYHPANVKMCAAMAKAEGRE